MTTPSAQLVDLMRRVHDDPELYAKAVLRVKLRRWQRDFFREIARRIREARAVGLPVHIEAHLRTCHGAGKTFAIACLVHWITSTRPESRTLTTAPTWSGVENFIWPEISRLYNGSLLRQLAFGRMLDTKFQATRVVNGKREDAEGWYAIGAASDRPENLEGHHSPVCAFRVVDEAKEVEDGVFDSTAGMLDAPETFDVWISTPSIQSGRFYERDANGGADVLRVVVTIDDLIAEGIPGKAAWKAARLKEWRADSDAYKARALAQYIESAEGTLFPYTWIERAMAQTWTVEGPLFAGFDVAGSVSGDESVVAVVVGKDPKARAQVLHVEGWHDRDTMASKGNARRIANLCAPPPPEGEDPLKVPLRVDGIGIGKGVFDSLTADGYPTEEYRASDKPNDETRFANRKAEDAWVLRTRMEELEDAPGECLLRLPADPKLRSQLAAMKYKTLPSGKMQVVDPSDSPDYADAVIIATAGEKAGDSAGFLAWIRAQNEEAEKAAREAKRAAEKALDTTPEN